MKVTRIAVVSHPRSGTNWVMHTLWTNLETNCRLYEHLFGAHLMSFNPKWECLINVTRNIYDCLSSVYRLRDHLRIGNISFSDFIITKYCDMPEIYGSRAKFVRDGIENTKKRAGRYLKRQEYTPPEWWKANVDYWQENSHISVSYENFSQRAPEVLDFLVTQFGMKRKTEYTPSDQYVGVKPLKNSSIYLTDWDREYLRRYETSREEFMLLTPKISGVQSNS